MTLHVGTLEEINEEEPNSQFESPQEIPLDVVVNGVIQREDVDYFVIEAEQGERVSIEIEGLRLGRTFFDPAIAVLDEDRFELARCDDAPLLRQDAFCSFLAPKAGRYTIEVRETAYRGDGNSTYRLHVGRFPRPAAVYPPGGRPGESLAVRWIGDPTGEQTETVTLPDDIGDAHELMANDPHGTSPSGVPVRVVDLPGALESEPNDALAEATEFSAPSACTGVIQAAGDRDHFRFKATKSEVFDLRMFAREVRSPLDPVLRVLDAKGKQVIANDDDRGRPDSYVRFKAPADGEYVLRVEDHLRAGGPDYIYRIEATRPTPTVGVRIEEQQRYVSQTVVVPRGNRAAIMVTATRRDMGGPLAISLPELPEGVVATPVPLAADYNRVPVLFEAADEAPLDAVLTPVVARLAEGEASIKSLFKQQTWLVRGRNNVPVWDHWADRAAIAVTERLPFKLTLIAPKAPLVQRGSKELRVVAERDEGFDAPIAVRMLYVPPGVSANFF
ncbi:MAG: PPC domain-containing protein, partial [Planctomycetota bacterium]